MDEQNQRQNQPGGHQQEVTDETRSQRLPHERDLGTDKDPGPKQDQKVDQAYRDVQGGLQDTDRSYAIGKVRDSQVNPDAGPAPGRKESP